MDHEFCLVAIPRTLQQGNYHETDTQPYLGGHYAARLHYLTQYCRYHTFGMVD